jgi:alkyl hydroperoxide reductase subunit AhpC
MTVRSVFIISPAKRVELIITYPAYIGRNFNEILRILDALQVSAQYRVATPANWQPGDDTVVLPAHCRCRRQLRCAANASSASRRSTRRSRHSSTAIHSTCS